MSTGYEVIIIAATGCSASEAEAEAIEASMRSVIFHSTLDWQTRPMLEQAACLAHTLLCQVGQTPQDGVGNIHRVPRRARTTGCVVFELTRSSYRALERSAWSIAPAVPGIREWSLQQIPGCGYYLTLAGSRRAITRAARLSNINEDEIQQQIGAIFGSRQRRL